MNFEPLDYIARWISTEIYSLQGISGGISHSQSYWVLKLFFLMTSIAVVLTPVKSLCNFYGSRYFNFRTGGMYRQGRLIAESDKMLFFKGVILLLNTICGVLF